MGDVLHGIDFFSNALQPLGVNIPSVGEGICAGHNRPATLYNLGGNKLCRGCVLLRQTYPMPSKGKLGYTRLGLGCYMLITEHSINYWGKHVFSSRITSHPASGALRDVVRNLLMAPPEPPWMFIAFARSNASDRMHVTRSNDLIQFSGKFFFPGTIDEPPVERLNRKRALALYAAADLTRQEWEQCARAQASLHYSADSLSFLNGIYERFPALASYPIPAQKTAEYNAVRLLAREK
jgi:hypothetical protein